MRRHGWPWFGGWALAGALVSFSIISAASIGLLTAPVALVAVWWIVRSRARGLEILGAVAGAGAPCLLVAALAAGPGDLDGRPWLAAGLVLTSGGVAAYAAARHRPQPPSALADRG